MEKKEKTKNGLYEYFYEGDHSDQIKWRGEYKDGLKHGLVEAFHRKNGYLIRKELWKTKGGGPWKESLVGGNWCRRSNSCE